MHALTRTSKHTHDMKDVERTQELGEKDCKDSSHFLVSKIQNKAALDYIPKREINIHDPIVISLIQ